MIICFGDSNTYGYDPRSYFGGRYSADNRWVDVLAQACCNRVVNEGMNGRRIPTDTIKLPDDIDLLIVMLGTNDILSGMSAKSTAQKMEHFIECLGLEIRKILLIAPPPLKLGEWVSDQSMIEESKKLGAEFKIAAEQLGIQFADSAEWNVGIAFDGVHFSEEGHNRFAEKIYEEIKLRGEV